jgi:hypothetical protein
VRKSRTPGSVRGVLGNGHPYRDTHGRRRKLNDKYDYRYSQLIWVFARLIREGRIREERLAGVSEEKLSYIRRMLQP